MNGKIAKLERLLKFMDGSIASNENIIEKQSENMPDYCAGVSLVNDDLKYIRRWLGKILDDN